MILTKPTLPRAQMSQADSARAPQAYAAQSRRVELDVREYHSRGEEPFAAIMAVVESLRDGQEFVLVNTFEPLPLYRVMANGGFRHRAEQVGPGHWRITFSRSAGGPAAEVGGAVAKAPAPGEADGPDPELPPIELDNRGLEPPQPMVRILAGLEQALPGQAIVATNERKPLFLFPLLEERGCRHRTEEQPDGTWRITVWRPS